jgi:hypothetical protein
MAKTARSKPKSTGSTINASDAVDDVRLPPKPTAEQVLDEGVKETFPASDPVSTTQPANTAHERKKRGEAQPVPPQPPKRSPDWMFDKRK